MKIRAIIQKTLDKILLPEGIVTSHLRRLEIDEVKVGNKKIAVNKNEYVVFRIVSSQNKTFGDGNAQLYQYFIDVNYYYSYVKSDKDTKKAESRIEQIINAILALPNFKLANGQNDLYDLDNPYRGINVEFKYIEVADNGR